MPRLSRQVAAGVKTPQQAVAEAEQRWATKAIQGDWKGGVERAIQNNRTPGRGLAVLFGIPEGQVNPAIDQNWRDGVERTPEEYHERQVRRAAEENKWSSKLREALQRR